jgi:phosphate-selective porin OprO/OprP
MKTGIPEVFMVAGLLLACRHGLADDADLQKRLTALEAELAKIKAQPALTKVDGGLRAQSADGQYKVRFGGRMQADYAFYDKDLNELGSGSELRTMRMRMMGSVSKSWDYKLEADFLPAGGVRITEAYIAYKGMPNAVLMAGNLFELYGLEEFSSSTDITFMERSIAVDAIVPDYNQGVSYTRWGDSYNIAAGIFGNSTNDTGNATTSSSPNVSCTATVSCNESWGYSTRFVFAPMHEVGNTLSLGLSAYWRDPVTDSWRVRARPDSHVTGARLVDTGMVKDVKDVMAAGVEASWTSGPLSVQAEYNQQMLSRDKGAKDAEYKGWYVYGSYILTGETRPWDMPSATYGRVSPRGANGAWELALRFDSLDLNDTGAGVAGGKIDNVTLGLNWYANNNIKLMLNLVKVKAEKDYDTAKAGLETDEPNIVQMRAQVAF